jgi:hypothetical protein
MKDVKKTPTSELKGSIFELLQSFAPKNATDKKTPVVAKLSNSQQSLLKNAKDLKPLSAQQLAAIKPILLSVDPSFSLVVQIALTAFQNKKIGAVIAEDCAKLVSVLAFNMNAGLQTSIYFSLKSCSTEKVDLARFTNELCQQFERAIIAQKQNSNGPDLADVIETISPALIKRQQQNIPIIGLLWCLQKGRADPVDVIEYLSHEYSKDEELGTEEILGLTLFLNKMLFKPESKKLFQLVKYFIDKVGLAERQRIFEQSKVTDLSARVDSLVRTLAHKEAQTAKYDTDIAQLKENIAQLENSLDSQKKLGTADVVHLKDDHNKVKSKTLNLFEEDVIPLLRTSLHALNKDTPKTHVAIHNIDLVLDNIEGTIKWLKK